MSAAKPAAAAAKATSAATTSKPAPAAAQTDEVWQWLAQAEDSLEKTVLEFNALAVTTDKLERRSLTQEILIKSLRAEKRAKDAQIDQLAAQAQALEQLLASSKSQQQQLREEVGRCRSEIAVQKLSVDALHVLASEAAAGRAQDRARIHQLAAQEHTSLAQAGELVGKVKAQDDAIQLHLRTIAEWKQAHAALQDELVQSRAATKKQQQPTAAAAPVKKEQEAKPVAAAAAAAPAPAPAATASNTCAAVAAAAAPPAKALAQDLARAPSLRSALKILSKL